MKKRILLYAILWFILFSIRGFSQSSQELSALIADFQIGIQQKDSMKLQNLFFDKNTTIIGRMSPRTEMAIQKNYPEFEGLSIANSEKFIREICASPKKQEEKFYNTVIEIEDRIASVSFDYAFLSNENIYQWGHEKWALVYTENKWLISSILYTIRFPKEEPFPYKDE